MWTGKRNWSSGIVQTITTSKNFLPTGTVVNPRSDPKRRGKRKKPIRGWDHQTVRISTKSDQVVKIAVTYLDSN
jgi:hypothetical protein